MLKLYNTLTKKIEEFKPLHPDVVKLYCCGPTVYDYAHIGNFRTYTMTDLLVRTLRYLDYKVKYVMNVTDVGHLVSDADVGEDKMEKGARREGKTAWDIAKFYTEAFLEDSKKLNLLEPDVLPKPTEHIKEQVEMVQKLLDKGYAYQIDDGVYFDTSKFSSYGQLTGQKLEELKEGARVEPNPQKKNPTDFALWKFSPSASSGRVQKRDMEWDSPWGKGFPGWHIECSAMSMKYLGDQLDIHTGGADLIPVHHTNEIAQSEAVTGHVPFVRYWVHGQFVLVDGEKMSKSKGNFYRLADIEKKGFDPLSLRYFYFTAHYRSFLNFTWEALEGAQNSLKELRLIVSRITSDVSRTTLSEDKLKKIYPSYAGLSRQAGSERLRWVDTQTIPIVSGIDAYRKKFDASITDDLNMPQALAVVWEVVKSNIPSQDKYDLLMDFDEVLGLDLKNVSRLASHVSEIPKEIEKLMRKREAMRKEKKFDEADQIRKQIEEKGYTIEDMPQGKPRILRTLREYSG